MYRLRHVETCPPARWAAALHPGYLSAVAGSRTGVLRRFKHRGGGLGRVPLSPRNRAMKRRGGAQRAERQKNQPITVVVPGPAAAV